MLERNNRQYQGILQENEREIKEGNEQLQRLTLKIDQISKQARFGVRDSSSSQMNVFQSTFLMNAEQQSIPDLMIEIKSLRDQVESLKDLNSKLFADYKSQFQSQMDHGSINHIMVNSRYEETNENGMMDSLINVRNSLNDIIHKNGDLLNGISQVVETVNDYED